MQEWLFGINPLKVEAPAITACGQVWQNTIMEPPFSAVLFGKQLLLLRILESSIHPWCRPMHNRDEGQVDAFVKCACLRVDLVFVLFSQRRYNQVQVMAGA